MKDEIKEIITEMQIRNGRYIMCKNEDISFSDEDYQAHLLLDYITNLQEENESLHTRIKTIKRRRKEQTSKIRKYRDEITNKQNSNKDYKQRIDKAIEFIEYLKETTTNEWKLTWKELLNILQGKSDE